MSRPDSGKEKPSSNETIVNATPATEGESPKGKGKSGNKAKATMKSSATKKTASKPKAERSNKKAEVTALTKRAKAMKVTGWQAHTVRGFVSILGKKGGEKIESAKSADDERNVQDQIAGQSSTKRRFRLGRGGVSACVGHVAHSVTAK